MSPDEITVSAALVAGLAASGHCIAMCGGVAGALAVRSSRVNDRSTSLVHMVAYNLARVLSYCFAGALAGAAGGALFLAADAALLEATLRIAAAALMLATAGKLLFNWRLLEPVEAAGAVIWRRLIPGRPTALAGRRGLTGVIALGMGWGWLPCGMSYSMLLLASTTADPAAGASVMLAFGAGTLPAMLTTSLALARTSRPARRVLPSRRWAGILLVAFGVWTVGSVAHDAWSSAHHHRPASARASVHPAHH